MHNVGRFISGDSKPSPAGVAEAKRRFECVNRDEEHLTGQRTITLEGSEE